MLDTNKVTKNIEKNQHKNDNSDFVLRWSV